MIDPTLTALIKSRVSLKSILEQHGMRFQRKGRNHVASCPFHSEKTASFTIWPDDKAYFCFGCHKSGDAVSFIMERDGLDFLSALQALATAAGVELPDPDPHAAALKAKKARLIEINALACDYFQKSLEHPRAESVTNYLIDNRHLNTRTIEKFGLGYAPFDHDNTRFRDTMNSHGVKLAELIEAGLWHGNHPYFRQRVMIPIKDRLGQVIAFAGRDIGTTNPDSPKYLNSPTTLIFDKGGTLYGLSEAKDAMRRKNSAIVVEGYFDVILTHQAGFDTTVAVMGTSLSLKHLELIQRFTTEVYICYDGDQAGQEATNKAVDLVSLSQDSQVHLKIMELPNGYDPDGFVADFPGKWATIFRNAPPVVDFYLEKSKLDCDLSTAQGKSKLVDNLMPLLRTLKDRVEREHYLNLISTVTTTSMEALTDRLGQVARPALVKTTSQIVTLNGRENALLRTIIQYFPRSFDISASDGFPVQGSDFYDEENRVIFQALKSAHENWEALDTLSDKLDTKTQGRYHNLWLGALEAVDQSSIEEEVKTAVKFELNKLRKQHYKNVYLQIVDEMQSLDKDDPIVLELAESAIEIDRLQKIYN
jgi:DNA primase